MLTESTVRDPHIFSTKASKAAVPIWPLCRGTLLGHEGLGSYGHCVSRDFVRPALPAVPGLQSCCSPKKRAVQLLGLLPGHKLLALEHSPVHTYALKGICNAAAHLPDLKTMSAYPRSFETMTSFAGSKLSEQLVKLSEQVVKHCFLMK